MQLIQINTIKSNDLNSFVDSWSKLYSYNNESIYKNAISKKVFEIDDIQNLFVWKNGMKLSVLKQKSLETNILNKLEIINYLKNDFNLETFKIEFKKISAVWKIFLLHIIKPNLYPIYDQHIHRTFLFIHSEDYSTISNTSINNKQKETFYFERYFPFIQKESIKDIKKLDEAFFAFGQFLNTRNYKILVKL